MSRPLNFIGKIGLKSRFYSKLFTVLLVGIISSGNVLGNNSINSHLSYIERYADLAMLQMKKHKIPASSILGQAVLESGAGTSYLAVHGNNHFGIKDKPNRPRDIIMNPRDNEFYVKYASVEESFEDHSLFLRERSWYAPLFKLNIEDYKGWARGLQECGYATDPLYPQKLINIIERYDLTKYDRLVLDKK